MINIIDLQLKMIKKKLKKWSYQSGHVMLLLIILLVGLGSLQYNLFARVDYSHPLWQGWVILGLLLLNALFGMISSRIPCHLHDITWIYSVPKSTFQILIALFLSKMIPRLSIWLLSAVTVEFIMILSGAWSHIFVKALICYSIFFVFDLVAFALSTLRGNVKASSFSTALIVVLGIGFGILTYFIFNENVPSLFSGMIIELGQILNGTLHLSSSIFLISLISFCLIIIYLFCETPKFKEKLVFEADFWSQYESFNTLINSARGQSSYTSWWGGKVLTNSFAFVWFELLLLRKGYKSLLFHFIVTVALSFFLFNISPLFYYVMFTFLILANLVSGFVSGTIRHYYSDTLLTTPGSLFVKVLLIESTSLLPNSCSLILLNFIAQYLGVLPSLSIVILIHLLFLLSLMIRIHVFSRLIVNREITAWTYYKHVIAWSLLTMMTVLLICLFPLNHSMLLNTVNITISIILLAAIGMAFRFIHLFNKLQITRKDSIAVSRTQTSD